MIPLEADAESLRAAASGYDDAVQTLDGLAETFEQRLAGLGEPWGADDVGSAIGQCYLPAVDAALECLDANAAELDRYRGNLAVMADSYDRTDDDGRLDFDRLHGRLDQGRES